MSIIVNFKAYKSAVGKEAVRLATICERVARKYKISIAVAVQPADIAVVSSSVRIPVLAQHVDFIDFGAHTGWVLPESVRNSGAVGSLLNHSEHRIPLAQIKSSILRLRKLGLISIVCADTSAIAVKISKFKPDVIAVEPSALIGGKISVSDANPGIITQTTHKIRDIPVLCGAGIHTEQDVSKALELGAKGVLVASGVTNAKNPEKELISLVKGFIE